jgi:thiamine biosynthesis lipoprotein
MIFLLLLLISCQERESNLTTLSGVAMTIPYTIHVAGGLHGEKKERCEALIGQTFEKVNRIYNKWNPESELSSLNRLKAFEKRKISKELFELLELSNQIVILSQGRFDPTIEPLQALWKLSEASPTPLEQREVLPLLGWEKIHFDDGIFYKEHDLTALDLGAIAKGLAVDLLAEGLEQEGFSPCFVEWGGEIRAVGAHPEGRPWTIFISRFGDPDPDHSIATLPLDERGVATSGDYNQIMIKGGKKLSHIYSRSKLSPLPIEKNGIKSATVIAPSCAMADALATCCFLFETTKECIAWAEHVQEEHPDVRFILAAPP